MKRLGGINSKFISNGINRSTSANLRYLRYQYQVQITAAAQTTTPKFTFGAGAPAAEVDWGDSTRSTVTSGVELSHAYAAPGVYTVTLHMQEQETYLQQVDLGIDNVAGDLWLRNLCRFGALTHLEIGTNPNASGVIALSDLNLVHFGAYGCANLTVSGALTDLPATVASLILHQTQGVIVGGSTPMVATGIQSLRLSSKKFNQSQVDEIINRIYQDRAQFTSATPQLNIGGANAAPSGVYQDATPPTTGKEMIYKLVNDPDAEGFRKWTIIYTA